MNYLRIYSALENSPWAITANAMETIHRILAGETTPEAVAAKMGRPLENTGGRVTMRGSTAILDVSGPLFRHANLLTEVSGATSVETLSTAFHSALDNRAVQNIVLEIDSPGGEVAGILQLSDMIRAGGQKKPVYAYVDGMAASGGYWLASAAGKIIADESALLGSIGVVATIRDSRAAQERQGVRVHEIVSSQSPYKRPDVATEDGRAQILEIVNSTADLFIGRVAKFRGVTEQTVLDKFGKGKSMIARQAKDAGMVDQLSSFEGFLTSLDEGTQTFSFPAAASAALLDGKPVNSAITPKEEGQMSAENTITNNNPPANPAVPDQKVIASAVTADRSRIASILNCEEAKGREKLANKLAFDEKGFSVEDAKAILAAAEVAVAAPPTNPNDPGFAAHMAKLKNPAVGSESAETVTAADEANAILQFVPANRRIGKAA